MIKILAVLACGAVLGVVGCAVWLIWYVQRDGGMFRW